jgi:DMSO/TMAO reductase YedYZ molybdopterin-dependent catalytic subunit
VRIELRNRVWPILALIAGIVLIASAAVYYFSDRAIPSDWDLTLVGKHGEQRVVSYGEIKELPSREARGGFFTTVGVVNGPYDVKGVLLRDICALVGGLDPDNLVSISAADGYSMVFDADQLAGDIETYDPVTLREVPHEELVVLLVYEQDGRPLSETDGRPLRLAVVGSEALLTEGHNWVKWVNRIEVVNLD